MTRIFSSILTLLLFASITAPAFGAILRVDDDDIYDQVNRKLNNDTDIHGRLKIEVKDAVVTLSGLVESDKIKSKAEKLAKKVQGVKQVINKIEVGTDKPPK